MNRKNATDFPQELLDIYDEYVHGIIDRRLFFSKAAKFAVAGVTVAALVNSLSPHYAWAEQLSQSDSRLKTEYASYDSPDGHGKMRGYLARPANSKGALPGVIVVHENRGLNPYVEDVARRAAVAGFVAFAPDALTPLGGYPGNDDEGRTMQRKLDGSKIVEDFVAATHFLHKHDACNKSIGVVGFCFGGGMSNTPLRGTRQTRQRGLARLRNCAESERDQLHCSHLPQHQPRFPQRHNSTLRRSCRETCRKTYIRIFRKGALAQSPTRSI
jgi:carboxymethylenebutenolidase